MKFIGSRVKDGSTFIDGADLLVYGIDDNVFVVSCLNAFIYSINLYNYKYSIYILIDNDNYIDKSLNNY